MFIKTEDGLNMYYEQAGNLHSEHKLLFLNGISQSTHAWNLTLPAFTPNYHIILCDLIFQGQSDKQGAARSFDQHATDVFNLIEALNIEKINLTGISYGSIVVQHFALRYPEKIHKLILLSTFAHKTPYYKAIETMWSSILDAGSYAGFQSGIIPPVLQEQLLHASTQSDVSSRINEIAALKNLLKPLIQREDYREKLKEIKTPALVMHGENDLLVPIEMGKAVADTIPLCRFDLVKRAGHLLNIHEVHYTSERMNQFLGDW